VAPDLHFLNPQPDTSQSCKTMDTGLVHYMVCPLTPQLLLVLINQPQRDGRLSWNFLRSSRGWDSNPRPCGRRSGTIPHGHCTTNLYCNTDANISPYVNSTCGHEF